MALDPTRQALAEALDVCASVSKSNLAKRGDTLAWTLVNPYALRRLADALEALVPGAIDSVREANARRREDAQSVREAAERARLETADHTTVPYVWRPMASVLGNGTCEARARLGTGEGVCGRLLDRHGQCDRASAHIG